MYEPAIDPTILAMQEARQTAKNIVRQVETTIGPVLDKLDAGLLIADRACIAVQTTVVRSVSVANATLLDAASRLHGWVQGTTDSAGDTVANKLEAVTSWLNRLIQDWFSKFE